MFKILNRHAHFLSPDIYNCCWSRCVDQHSGGLAVCRLTCSIPELGPNSSSQLDPHPSPRRWTTSVVFMSLFYGNGKLNFGVTSLFTLIASLP